MPDVLREIGLTSLVMTIFGPMIYSMTIRKRAWNASLFFAGLFQWDILRTEKLSYIPPYHITIILRSLFSSFSLLLLWRGSNIVFTAFAIQEPLKRGEPLTKDSNDPNGSLINGLKSRKSLIKTFAYWELVLISRRFGERRVSIFKDIEREGGSAWSQISAECLKMIEGVFLRIEEFEHPPKERKQFLKPEDLQSLPRIGTPLKQEAVFLKSPPPASRLETIEANVGSVVKSYGDNQFAGYGSPIGPKSKKAFEITKNKLLTPEQQEALSYTSIRSHFNEYLMLFVRSPLGMPFRQTFSRRIRSITLGKPYSELVEVVDAIESLTCLTAASLNEDVYGGVSKTVPLILRVFIKTHQALERLAKGLNVHWTDVEFTEEDRWAEDIRIILDALRHGMTGLVKGFGGFKAELGLQEEEMRIAKAIVATPKKA